MSLATAFVSPSAGCSARHGFFMLLTIETLIERDETCLGRSAKGARRACCWSVADIGAEERVLFVDFFLEELSGLRVPYLGERPPGAFWGGDTSGVTPGVTRSRAPLSALSALPSFFAPSCFHWNVVVVESAQLDFQDTNTFAGIELGAAGSFRMAWRSA